MTNFWATDTLYNLFEYFQYKDIDSNKTLQKPQYTNGSIKEHIPRTVKRQKVPALEIPESSVSLSSSTLPILSWKLRIIACRGRSMIRASCKLELFCQYVMSSWHYIVTKSSIIVDMGPISASGLFVFCAKIIKKINQFNIYMFGVKRKSTRTRFKICSKLTIKAPKWR